MRPRIVVPVVLLALVVAVIAAARLSGQVAAGALPDPCALLTDLEVSADAPEGPVLGYLAATDGPPRSLSCEWLPARADETAPRPALEVAATGDGGCQDPGAAGARDVWVEGTAVRLGQATDGSPQARLCRDGVRVTLSRGPSRSTAADPERVLLDWVRVVGARWDEVPMLDGVPVPGADRFAAPPSPCELVGSDVVDQVTGGADPRAVDGNCQWRGPTGVLVVSTGLPVDRTASGVSAVESADFAIRAVEPFEGVRRLDGNDGMSVVGIAVPFAGSSAYRIDPGTVSLAVDGALVTMSVTGPGGAPEPDAASVVAAEIAARLSR